MSTRRPGPAVVWWVECGTHRAELYDDGSARCSCGTSWAPDPRARPGYRHQRYARAQLDVHVQWAAIPADEKSQRRDAELDVDVRSSSWDF